MTSQIVSVTLTPEQAEVLGPLIDAHLSATGVVGLLGAVTRSYKSAEGRVTLQLELIPLNRKLAAALSSQAKKTQVGLNPENLS